MKASPSSRLGAAPSRRKALAGAALLVISVPERDELESDLRVAHRQVEVLASELERLRGAVTRSSISNASRHVVRGHPTRVRRPPRLP